MSLHTRVRVIDTETTGLTDPIGVVEIGWTDVEQHRGRWAVAAPSRSILVQPGRPIEYGAVAVHHIRDSDVEAAKPLSHLLPTVLSGAEVLAAHNAAFDAALVDTDLPWICTHKCARALWPDLQGYSNGGIRYELGLIDALWEPHCHPAHRAGPDTVVTAHILCALLREATISSLLEISGRPTLLSQMPFGKHKGERFDALPHDYLNWIVNASDMRHDPDNDVVYTARRELERRAI